jgi:hypothetical protein
MPRQAPVSACSPKPTCAVPEGLLDAEVSVVTVAKAYKLLKAILNVAVKGG